MQGLFKLREKRLLPTLLGLIGVALLGCDSAKEPVAVKPVEPLVTAKASAPAVAVPTFDLAPWQAAQIDWRQFAGSQLTVLGDAQGAFQSLQPLLPAFEQLTGIKVGLILIQQEDMRKKLRTDLTSGGGIYDVVPEGITDLGEAKQAGWLEPLEPYLANRSITDPAWFNYADFSAKVISLCQVDGQLLSLPFDFSAPVFFYRKDLFEKYKIAVPDTYEDVVAMKHKLQAALDADGVKGIDAFTTRTTVGAGDNTWTVIPTIRAYGGEMFDAQWRPTFNSPQAVQALNVYRDMVTGYGSPAESRTQHFVEQRQLFRDGKLASGIFASHIFAYLNDPEHSQIVGKWDAAPPPQGPAGRFTSPWAWAFAMNAQSKNKQAAWLFMQWAASKETAQLLGAGVGPARQSVWTPEYAAKLNAPGLATAYQWIFASGVNSPFQMGVAEFPEAGLVASKAFSEIFYAAPVAATLDEAASKAEAIMAAGPSRKALTTQ
jgi:multiple sugar transport system substrate-binding protein